MKKSTKKICSIVLSATLMAGQSLSYGTGLLSWLPGLFETHAEETESTFPYEVLSSNSDLNGAQLVDVSGDSVLQLGDIATDAACSGVEITNPFAGKTELQETFPEAFENYGVTFNGVTVSSPNKLNNDGEMYPYVDTIGNYMATLYLNGTKMNFSDATTHVGEENTPIFYTKQDALDAYYAAVGASDNTQFLNKSRTEVAEGYENVTGYAAIVNKYLEDNQITGEATWAELATTGTALFQNEKMYNYTQSIRDGVDDEEIHYSYWGPGRGGKYTATPGAIEGEFSYPLPKWENGVTVSAWVKVPEDVTWSAPIFSFTNGNDGLTLRTNGDFMYAGELDRITSSTLYNTYSARFEGETPVDRKGEWVYVTLSIKNDEVHVYYDGVEAKQELSTASKAAHKFCKYFNGGFGLKAWGTNQERTNILVENERYSALLSNFGAEETDFSDMSRYYYYENRLMMDFVTDEDTKLFVGGDDGTALYNTRNCLYNLDSTREDPMTGGYVHWASCDEYSSNYMFGALSFEEYPAVTSGEAVAIYEEALQNSKTFIDTLGDEEPQPSESVGESEEPVESQVPVTWPEYMELQDDGVTLVNTRNSYKTPKTYGDYTLEVTRVSYNFDNEHTLVEVSITNNSDVEKLESYISMDLFDDSGNYIYSGGSFCVMNLEPGATVNTSCGLGGTDAAFYCYDFVITGVEEYEEELPTDYSYKTQDGDDTVLEFGDIATGAACVGKEITNPFAGKYELQETFAEAFENYGTTFNGITFRTPIKTNDVGDEYPVIAINGNYMANLYMNGAKINIYDAKKVVGEENIEIFNTKKKAYNAYHAAKEAANSSQLIDNSGVLVEGYENVTGYAAIASKYLADNDITSGATYAEVTNAGKATLFQNEKMYNYIQAIADGYDDKEIHYTYYGPARGGENLITPGAVEGEFSYPLPKWENGVTISTWVKVPEDAKWSAPIFSFTNGTKGLTLRTNGDFMYVGDEQNSSAKNYAVYSSEFMGETPFDNKGQWVFVTLSVKNDEVHVHYNGAEAYEVLCKNMSWVGKSFVKYFNGGFGLKAWGTDEERVDLLLSKEWTYRDLLRNYSVEETDYTDASRYYYEQTAMTIIDLLTDESTKFFVGGDDGTALYSNKGQLYGGDSSVRMYPDGSDYVHWAACTEYSSGLRLGAMYFEEYPIVTTENAVEAYEEATKESRSFNQIGLYDGPEASEEPIPQVSEEPIPQVSEEPEPQVSEEPIPQVSEEPEPQVSEEPIPQVSEVPEPQVSEEPIPQVSEVPEPAESSLPSAEPQTSEEPMISEEPIPVVSAEPESLKGDIDFNGSVELVDAQMALKMALRIDLASYSEEQKVAANVNEDQDGDCELFDAKQILQRALGIISEYLTGISQPYDLLDTVLDAKMENGKLVCTISVENQGFALYDIGLHYDNEYLTVEDISWNMDFLNGCIEQGGMMAKSDIVEDSYAVIGGIFASRYSYTGTIATITFNVNEGATDVDDLVLMLGSGVKNGDFTGAEELLGTVTLDVNEIIKAENETPIVPEVIKGDINLDGEITLEDTSLALRMALLIQSGSTDAIKLADVDGDGQVTLSDVQQIIKRALLIIADFGTSVNSNTLNSAKINAEYKDNKLYCTVSVDSQDMTLFDVGLVYDNQYLTVEKMSWDSEFMEDYTLFGGIFAREDITSKSYIAIGGAKATEYIHTGDVLTIVFTVKEDAKDVDNMTLIPNCGYMISSGLTLEELLSQETNDVLNVNDVISESTIPEKEVTTEQIPNEDGTVTDKVTEKETTEDGTVIEKVTETTTATDGAVKEKVEETVTNPDGSKETTTKETTTNPDGTLEELESIIKEDADGLLISILKELLQIAKDIYEKLTTTEKELEDGSKIIKELAEISKVDDDGNIVKESKVKDEKKNKDGKSIEKYEYDAKVLPEDVEWETSVIEDKDLEDKHKESFNQKGIKDYEAYDINPKANGKKVDVKDGKVKVSLECKEEWKGKKVRVYDMENDKWLDAQIEGEHVTFYAEHFSQYAIVASVNYTLGNIDGEGNIELSDAQLALRLALLLEDNPTEEQELAADVDENGAVELKDAQQILRRALLLIEEFEKAQ